MEEAKMLEKEPSGSLLKEQLSKQDVVNGLKESQESRMASIRAEADKVYTFTDNAPSPFIGSSSRLDCGSLGSGDGTTTKTTSPAYSDISDAGDDGVSDCRSGTPPAASIPAGPVKDPQSPFYHRYDHYYIQNYMQTGQSNTAAFHMASTPQDGKYKKEDSKDGNERRNTPEFIDLKKTDVINSSSQSQIQMAMTQTQTALSQSLYYGQYARGLYMNFT
ncbi:unnamed protein product [Coregonus sp. 'balchen']|nr:unnamed protein product [Coregonus sp. 'balchen']